MVKTDTQRDLMALALRSGLFKGPLQEQGLTTNLASSLNGDHPTAFLTSTSREAASCSATQEITDSSCNRTVHYSVHKIPPLYPCPKPHKSSPHGAILYLHQIRFYITLFLVVSFLLAFPPVPYMHYSPHSCYITCLSHPPSFDHSNYTWRRVQPMKPLIMQFPPISCHFISFRPKYSQHPVLKHPQSMFLS
jgi:hypothetical protein